MNSHIKSHLKRDRYGSNLNGFPVPANNEVQRNNGIRFCIQDEITESKFRQLNQAKEEMNQSHEQDMEIGYEETPPTPTYEGLEQRFKDEIMKLAGEQSDAVNAEFIRYKERILEINTEYQEMLSALKAQQATRREEFLRKELQARLNQYHEDKRNQCPNTGVPDLRGYTGNLAAGEAIGRSHGASEHKHDGEQAPWLPSWRSEGSDARVILTAGEASGRLHGATEYNHDGGRMPPLPSWRSEETEARVASTAGETIGRFHGPTESKHDKERSPTLPSGRGELRVPLPPGRVYNNRAEYH
ncbi:PREDICTED: uncharacterized protein LOC109359331 [Lupinus angustifolius]|uniref:uncharacterized protein LOC109359331 n=1 Tax=Lupinus angustifolius TaxID=3871 RepID=UPI00092FC97F|nr:PREDICTED: uncharacterized protein LOC109359331 [Lupinus angustifolius]